MNKKKLKILICICMTFSLMLADFSVLAASVQEKINNATKTQKEALSQIEASKKEKNTALAQQEKLDKEIDLLNAELSEIDKIISNANSKIADKEKEISEFEQQIELNDDEFRKRLRAMDENDTSSYIDLLLSAESFSDFLSRLETVREITEHDQSVINRMIELKTGVEKSKNEIVLARDEQKQARNLVNGKKSQVNTKLQEKKNLVTSLESDIKKYEKAYNQAKQQEESLKASLSASLSSSGSSKYAGGIFAWPAPACTYISSEFGYRTHPILKTTKYHSGLDMAAPGGSNVLAANDGVVKLASWNGGYGNCVVIDHGGGVATLYGHNSAILVSVGTKVKRSQVIAKVGSTGMSTGNHLHFEVLVNGKATNPRAYLQ